MKTILVVPKGELPTQIKKQLIREGYMPIEVSDPSKIRLLSASELSPDADTTLMAAFAAIGNATYVVRADFADNLIARVKAKEYECSKQSPKS